MSSVNQQVSRRGARILLAFCLLAMAWYGYYQIGHLMRLAMGQLSLPTG